MFYSETDDTFLFAYDITFDLRNIIKHLLHVRISCHLRLVVPLYVRQMSLVVRKRALCKCENKYADQLCSNCTADLRLCFRQLDSTVPLFLNPKFQPLAIFCGCTARFVSDLAGMPKTVFFFTTSLELLDIVVSIRYNGVCPVGEDASVCDNDVPATIYNINVFLLCMQNTDVTRCRRGVA